MLRMTRALVVLAAAAIGCGSAAGGAAPLGPDSATGPFADATIAPDAPVLPADAALVDALVEPADGALAPADAPVTADAPTDSAPGDGAPALCGHITGDPENIERARGLAFARDGTLYYNTGNRLWRTMRPTLVPFPLLDFPAEAGSDARGLALDAARKRVYVGAWYAHKIYVVDLTAARPAATTFLTDVTHPHSLTLGADGNLYYSDQEENHVYRVTPNAARVRVTASALPNSSGKGITGIAFDPQGRLYVAAPLETVHRLTLGPDGLESGRTPLALDSLDSARQPQGIAFDKLGRIYVATSPFSMVIKYTPEGQGVGIIASATPFNDGWGELAFGIGAFRCDQLYVASVRRMGIATTDAEGLMMPWQKVDLGL